MAQRITRIAVGLHNVTLMLEGQHQVTAQVATMVDGAEARQRLGASVIGMRAAVDLGRVRRSGVTREGCWAAIEVFR
jgi:hypothetical protein